MNSKPWEFSKTILYSILQLFQSNFSSSFGIQQEPIRAQPEQGDAWLKPSQSKSRKGGPSREWSNWQHHTCRRFGWFPTPSNMSHCCCSVNSFKWLIMFDDRHWLKVIKYIHLHSILLKSKPISLKSFLEVFCNKLTVIN